MRWICFNTASLLEVPLPTNSSLHDLEVDSSRDIPDKPAEGNEDNQEAGILGSLGKTVTSRFT